MRAEIYTLGDLHYERVDVIDQYMSCIWKEQFIEPGEFELTLPATDENRNLLPKGTLLEHSQSRQPMIVDTRETQDGILKVTGKDVLAFFNQRIVHDDKFTDHPAGILVSIFTAMQDLAAEIEASAEVAMEIPNLVVGVMDESWDFLTVTEEIEGGPAGDALLKIAKKYGIGMGVYRVKNSSDFGYELHFSTYTGVDLFSTVRFASKMDNFANVRDLDSEDEYKSIAVAKAPNPTDTHLSVTPVQPAWMWNADYAGGDRTLPVFRQRMLWVDATDISDDDLSDSDSDELMRQLEADALISDKLRAELNDKKRINLVDGEVIPESQFKYYEDDDVGASDTTYRMGDQVSVVGNYDDVQRVYVAEYIRSYDNTGPRAYPTFAEDLGPTGEGGIVRDTKRTHTFIVGPSFDAPIPDGTTVPPHSSHRGKIIAFRHVFHGGGSADINVYVQGTFLTTVHVTGTRKTTKMDPPKKMQQGDEVYIDVNDTSGDPSGLSFTLVYDK